jgi:hypothetical protein
MYITFIKDYSYLLKTIFKTGERKFLNEEFSSYLINKGYAIKGWEN